MRKGVAIGYIIALVLGVAVIALIGIWFVTSGGTFSKGAIETQCRAKALELCVKQDGIGSASLPAECPAAIERSCTSIIK